jgi:anthranilate synthase component 1
MTLSLIPITREIDADLDTPVSVYLKLANDTPSFLLESVSGGERVARYSFIGVQPRTAYRIEKSAVYVHSGTDLQTVRAIPHHQRPFDVLRKEMAHYHYTPLPGLPRLVGGLVGYLSYDAVRFFEPTLQLPLHEVPDGIFLFCDTLVAFDHTRGRALAIALAHGESEDARAEALARLDALEARLHAPLPAQPVPAPRPVQVQPVRSEPAFHQMVETAKEHIRAGDIFQVVLSQKVARTTNVSPFQIYRELRRLNPSPYMFFYDFANLHTEPFNLIGASPELHVRLENGRATLRPIAGTRRRGNTPEDDHALEVELLADPKERAEHVMLVDLGRNDLGRVCEYGSVQVTELMVIERYSHVMHIVSQVEGDLRPELDGFDLLAATFPAGTVSGAPKVKAMEIIANLEQAPRGPYAGVVGYFGLDGNMDTCIALRTLYRVGDQVVAQAGAGVVADSTPQGEYQECINKAMATMKAIEKAEATTQKASAVPVQTPSL